MVENMADGRKNVLLSNSLSKVIPIIKRKLILSH